uniref:SS nuclear autoantigen 1 n=2 Tax=Equus TaxID=9789 RepID=A0A9L0J8U0_EQUAS
MAPQGPEGGRPNKASSRASPVLARPAALARCSRYSRPPAAPAQARGRRTPPPPPPPPPPPSAPRAAGPARGVDAGLGAHGDDAHKARGGVLWRARRREAVRRRGRRCCSGGWRGRARAATMTQQGAALQNYNNELVKCIEDLCQKRDELCRQIQQEEDEKQRLQNEVRQLTEKLARVNENLARKIASRNEFDRTIAETEAAYLKILESSQTLLSVLKREAGNLTKATASEQKSSGGNKDS